MKDNKQCQEGIKERVRSAIDDYNAKNPDGQLDIGSVAKLVVDDRELSDTGGAEQYLSLRINARRPMLVHHLKRLSEVLGKSTDYFLGLKSE